MIRRSHARRLAPALSLALGLAGVGLAGSGCLDELRQERETLDTRLETHTVLPGTPSAEGLAYVQAVVDAHRAADRATEPEHRLEPLLGALEREPPAGDGTAELLHYELLARASELLLEAGEVERARALLEPRLESTISLPIDRAAARCLVALGDAAARTGDHPLAMSSYARALELLSLLLEEVEP